MTLLVQAHLLTHMPRITEILQLIADLLSLSEIFPYSEFVPLIKESMGRHHAIELPRYLTCIYYSFNTN